MKKYLFIVLLVGVWSCEDDTPPSVNITSSLEYYVNGVVTIDVVSSDEDGIDRLELYVNSTLTLTDDTEPYSFQWNTNSLPNGTYTIFVRSYDKNGNTADSPVNAVFVDKIIELWGQSFSSQFTTEINFRGAGVSGEIPSTIGDFVALTSLDLHANNLTGSIPPEIGNLSTLTYFNVEFNQLSGSIPSEIGNLVYVRELGMNDNQLSGSIPPEIGNVGSLTDLITIKLWNNQLSGIVPESICDTGLDRISIEENNLCPPYPTCIWRVGEQDTTNCN